MQPSVVPMQPHALTKDLERMKKVLKILITHNKAGPFKKPVNAISEGIYPDYFKVVVCPMDLTTVRLRLANGWYRCSDHCVVDILQVFNNAMLYNPPDHLVYQWATSLHELTTSLVDKIKRTKGGPVGRTPLKKKRGGQTESSETDSRDRTPPSPSIDGDIKKCENILETIMTEKSFRDCVTPFLVITTKYANDSYIPTDLDHIKKRLRAGFYLTPTQFAQDFRKMISETYRFCLENDPLIEQASELQHRFEIMFAKDVGGSDEEEDVTMADTFDETEVLSDILATGKYIEQELASFVKYQQKYLEDKKFDYAKKRFDNAKGLVEDIENLSEDLTNDIINVMRQNGEIIKIESDGSLGVEYTNLSSRTIKQVRELVNSKMNNFSNGILEEEENVDIMS